jgi:hypothetical protein
VGRTVYVSTNYQKKSREDHVIARAADLMDRVLASAKANNPMPIGEKAVDPRTVRKRLEAIPGDQLYDHYARHG